MDGFIKIERNIVNARFYKDVNAKVLYMHLRLLATYNGYIFGKYQLQAGQCVSSVRRLAEETGLTVKEVRGAIDRLIQYGEIETRERNKGRYGGTVFTLLNSYERERAYYWDTAAGTDFILQLKEAQELDVYFDITNAVEMLHWKKRLIDLEYSLQKFLSHTHRPETRQAFLTDLAKIQHQLTRIKKKEEHFGFC